jgi:protein SCO1
MHGLKNLTTLFIFILFFISNGYASNQDNHSHHKNILKQQNHYTSSKEEYELPDIVLVSSTGKKTSLTKELDNDSTIILNFIFTTCTAVCPIMSGTFATINKSLADKPVKMISISIDPEYDTPTALRAYSEKYHANDKWHFFTGTLADMITIQKAFNSFRGNKMNHLPNTFIRMPDKKTWLRINGFASANHIVNTFHSINKS